MKRLALASVLVLAGSAHAQCTVGACAKPSTPVAIVIVQPTPQVVQVRLVRGVFHPVRFVGRVAVAPFRLVGRVLSGCQ